MDRETLATRARYAVAAVLGLSILGLTYVLFDPDLGTPVPLFQEITCLGGGKLDVRVTDPQGSPELRVPEMGLKLTALGDGEPRRVMFWVYKREGPSGPWIEHHRSEVQPGIDLMSLAPVTNATQVYGVAKDLEGRYCKGTSAVITAPS